MSMFDLSEKFILHRMKIEDFPFLPTETRKHGNQKLLGDKMIITGWLVAR